MNKVCLILAAYCLWRGFNGYGSINFLSAIMFIFASFLEVG